MKPQSFQDKSQKFANASRSVAVEEFDQGKTDFMPSKSEVAGRAYANYLNQGSQHGHDVDDWLKAEAQLQEERNLIRFGGDGFLNRI
ncbi:MAG TPA: DUF2934 domain-containing protein [Opitutales bacterium]|nr:DUF2934 domain-containing protein [Opitutales bacterium]